MQCDKVFEHSNCKDGPPPITDGPKENQFQGALTQCLLNEEKWSAKHKEKDYYGKVYGVGEAATDLSAYFEACQPGGSGGTDSFTKYFCTIAPVIHHLCRRQHRMINL